MTAEDMHPRRASGWGSTLTRMDEETRINAARGYLAGTTAYLTVIGVLGIIGGLLFIVLGVLVDVRSGTYGTLVLGIIFFVAGVFQVVVRRPLRARRAQQLGHMLQIDPDRLRD